MTDPTHALLAAHGISAHLALTQRFSQTMMSVTAPEQAAESNGCVERINIHQAYGRFGNKFYQIMNALVMAKRLGCRDIRLPPLQCARAECPVEIDGVILKAGMADAVPGSTLNVTCYAPFGFEHWFGRLDATHLSNTARTLGHLVFPDVIDEPVPNARTLALHFRAGDVFTPKDYIHNWYVQPPASFYLLASREAWTTGLIEKVELVFEDRGNPAVAVVEAGLAEAGIPFTSAAGSLLGDLQRLAAADYIAASFGTFSEAVALMSRNLKGFYGFRTHSTQHDVRPFVQSRVGAILRAGGIGTWLIDDVELRYIKPRTWINTPEQYEIIRNFPEADLRIFEL